MIMPFEDKNHWLSINYFCPRIWLRKTWLRSEDLYIAFFFANKKPFDIENKNKKKQNINNNKCFSIESLNELRFRIENVFGFKGKDEQNW